MIHIQTDLSPCKLVVMPTEAFHCGQWEHLPMRSLCPGERFPSFFFLLETGLTGPELLPQRSGTTAVPR
jgi:hypothetical protein